MIDKFVHDQLSVWPAVAAKYRALKSIQTRRVQVGGMPVTLQCNPGRDASWEDGCPLCRENYMEHQLTLPFEGRKGRKYNVLVNRSPIFPNHLVIARDIHTPQTIWHRFPDMLDLAVKLDNYIVFYNSPGSGTSVPGHAHFQACPKGYMPLERAAESAFRSPSLPADLVYLASVKDASMYHLERFHRGIFILRAKTSKSMAKLFYRLLDCMNLFAEEQEPGLNAYAYFSEGEYRAIVCLRAAETSSLISGSADMAGYFLVAYENDFGSITPEDMAAVFDRECISEEAEERLLWRLVRTQPRIEVGIAADREIGFEIISDGAGPQKVSYREGKIDYNGVLYDELFFEAPTISTLFAEPSFLMDGRKYAGTLKFTVGDSKVQAVNIIGLEDYLTGALEHVADGASLTGEAVRLRTEAVRALSLRKEACAHRALPEGIPSSATGLVTWLEQKGVPPQGRSVPGFDISAESPLYTGLGNSEHGKEIRLAVDETWGKTLE